MARNRHGRVCRMHALLASLLLAAGLVGLVPATRAYYTHLLAGRLRQELRTVPDGRVEVVLEQAVGLGEPGIAVLVAGLGSPRQTVAQASKAALWDEMDRWATLGAGEWSPKLAALARALAEQADQFDPEAQADAADLAIRVLGWPLDDTVVAPGRVTGWCESVLRTVSVQRQLAGTRLLDQLGPDRADARPYPEGLSPPESTRQPSARMGRTTSSDRASDITVGLSEPRGDANPVEPPSSEPSTVARGDRPPVADVGPVRPRGPEGRSVERPHRLPTDAEGAEAIQNPDDSRWLRDPPNGSSVRSLVRFRQLLQAPNDSAERGPEASRRAESPIQRLMRQLHAADASEAASAERELKRRGFTAARVELARQLFHPDPEVRRQLARQLPQLGFVDAVPWLMELARDADAEVRRAAISLIATTGDPVLLARIEQLARNDSDPDIRRQAERIAEKRRQTQY